MIKYDGIDYDLNHLFQFEMLKQLIEAISRNQTQLNARIQEMSKVDFNEKDGYGVNDDKEEDGEDNNINEDNIDNKTLLKRLKMVERKVNDIKRLERMIKTIDDKTETVNYRLLSTSIEVDSHDKDIMDIKKDIAKLTKSISNVNNINNNNETLKDSNEGTYDQTQGQISNLEINFFKKFALVDKRNKKMEEENTNIKKDINDIINQTNDIKDQISQMKNDIGKTKDDCFNEKGIRDTQIKELSDNTNNQLSEINRIIGTNNNDMLSRIKESEDKITNNIMSLLNEKASSLLNEDLKRSDKDMLSRDIKEINTKMYHIEKELNSMKSLSSNDELKTEINTIKEMMKSKLILSDLDGLYDKFGFIEDTLNNLKDSDETQNTFLKNNSIDISAIWKKIEQLINVIRSNQDGNNSYCSKRPGGDLMKYVEIKLFNEEMKQMKERIEMMIKDIEEHTRYLNDLIPLSQSTATITDLQKMEKQLTIILTDNNQSNQKRYADRNETIRSIKSIETQLKQTMTDCIKKGNKSEHCMLASKPICNYKCASCENEIEDLNSKKWEYLPWKKYPPREMAEKTYRVI